MIEEERISRVVISDAYVALGELINLVYVHRIPLPMSRIVDTGFQRLTVNYETSVNLINRKYENVTQDIVHRIILRYAPK